MTSETQKIQLYSLATPNGQKISIALEEMEIPYEAHLVNITKGEQFSDWFKKINPNSKIPAIVDPASADGQPLSIMESGAILVYLAEKSGKMLPADPRLRTETLQWLFFQMANVGPMFGQFGHFFKYAAAKCDHPYPVERYKNETKRILKVMDDHLEGKSYFVGEQYTIADVSMVAWVNCLTEFYKAGEVLGVAEYKNVVRWKESVLSRPKTAKGMKVCTL
ncbi:MAG: glutathione S-transferase N-terminal domain-containing protein [Pseudobdellovibrio sp.]